MGVTVPLYPISHSRLEYSRWWTGEGQDSWPQVQVGALGLRLEIPLCLPAAWAGLLPSGPSRCDWVGRAESWDSGCKGRGREKQGETLGKRNAGGPVREAPQGSDSGRWWEEGLTSTGQGWCGLRAEKQFQSLKKLPNRKIIAFIFLFLSFASSLPSSLTRHFLCVCVGGLWLA